MAKAKISDFRPQERNANRHTPRGLGMLDKSMADNGFIGAMTSAADGGIFDGSARILTAYDRFGEEVEPIVIKADGTRPIIVVRTDIPSADHPKAKKLSIAANRIPAVDLDWDPEMLKAIGEEVDISDLFFDNEIENLFEKLEEDQEWEPEEEDDDALAESLDNIGKVESRVKLGEIWQLGRHKIACGDSTIEANVRALLGDAEIVLVHADPPYGMGKEKDGVMNDNLYREKLDDFQMKWWKACRGNVADNASAYIWGNAEDLWRLWYKGGLKDSERLTFRNQIIWDKKHGQGMGSDDFRMFPTVTEHCLFFMLGEQGFNNNADNYFEGWDSIVNYLDTEKSKAKLTIKDCKRLAGHSEKSGCHWFDKSQWMIPTEETYNAWRDYCQQKDINAFKKEYEELKKEYYATRAYFNNTHENMTDVWEYPRVQGEERWGHATPKPVDMIARIYKSSSPDDGVIYSPFLGSGTDIIAAQKMEGDRTVYGFELSPAYCEVILQRYENFTGDIARLVGTL